GHRTGDNALRYVVDLVSERVRPSDAVARFGGEEFVVLMPDTSQEQALELIERLQRDLTKTFFLANEDRLVITFSAGIAVWSAGESELDLIERADHAMYRAKLAGKNRVLAATDDM
ncbi:GGDEF domain-containing protein, partial [Laribacter hongkongensis]